MTAVPLIATAAGQTWVVDAPGGLNFRSSKRDGSGKRIKVLALPKGASVQATGRKSGLMHEYRLSSGKVLWAYSKFMRPAGGTGISVSEPEDNTVDSGETDTSVNEAGVGKRCTNCSTPPNSRLTAAARKIEEDAAATLAASKPLPRPTTPLSSASSAKKVANLIREARASAFKCRRSSSWHGHRTMCGNQTKGMCKAAVREAFYAVTRVTIAGGSAYTAGPYLLKGGMKKLKGYNARTAPPGAILVYRGGWHGHGHIEIKTAKSQYCSDYCSSHSMEGKRTLTGVYVFP